MNNAPISLETRVEFLVPLNQLSAERQARLLRQAEILTLRKKDRLFEQGDRDDFTFYLLEGEIEMFADGSLIKRVSGGEGASFQPLAQLQPRQMSAITRSRAQVLRVSRSLLEQLLSVDQPPPPPPTGSGIEVDEIDTTASSDWLLNLLQSELFRRIPQAHLQTLLDTLEAVTVSRQAVVVQQGQPGDYFYIVKSGTCEVVRTTANGREIRLAELGPGDTFGEEALVSGTARNASVRMTSDGELARLTQHDFTRLLQAPLLDAVSRAQADIRVAAGARWLDVRCEDEHAHNGLPGSLNIPLSLLRSRSAELPSATPYVAYCDSGGRSSAAAFLLAGRGYEVCFVTGGAVGDALPEPAAAPAATVATGIDDMVEVNARASSLQAELERARLTIERAQRMMAEAEALKSNAARIVASKLATERARIDAESAELSRKLSEAERLRAVLATREEAARQEATRRQSAVEQHVQQLEAEAHRRLQDEQQRLAALYQKQTDALESLQADRESELRARLQEELAAERGKLTEEFLRTAAALEQAREERRQALAAKDAATAEAQAIIAEFKAQQERLMAEQQAAFERERARLQAEAQRIEVLREEAARVRQEAETARAAARSALEQAQARQPAPRHTVDLGDFEQKVAAAEADLRQALAAETAATSAARDNQDERDRSYGTAQEINLLLQQELDEWVSEQTRLQESTLQQETLSKQREMADRIRQRAAAAKLEHEQQARSLLDEIEQQLRGS